MATSDAQKRANLKYKSTKLKRISLTYRKEDFDKIIQPAVDASGMPLNTFIKQAVQEKIDRDNLK